VPETNQWALLGALALNVEYTRKYGFDAEAAAKIRVQMTVVPPPSLFLEALQANLYRRALPAVAVQPEE
jgi:hypothetical protein